MSGGEWRSERSSSDLIYVLLNYGFIMKYIIYMLLVVVYFNMKANSTGMLNTRVRTLLRLW